MITQFSYIRKVQKQQRPEKFRHIWLAVFILAVVLLSIYMSHFKVPAEAEESVNQTQAADAKFSKSNDEIQQPVYPFSSVR